VGRFFSGTFGGSVLDHSLSKLAVTDWLRRIDGIRACGR
jgi:hypothetical protein